METMTIILLGAVLVAAVIAMEAGVLRLPTLRSRAERREENALLADASQGGEADATAARCVAMTAGGDRCVRVLNDRRSNYCWQHQRMAQQLDERGVPLAP